MATLRAISAADIEAMEDEDVEAGIHNDAADIEATEEYLNDDGGPVGDIGEAVETSEEDDIDDGSDAPPSPPVPAELAPPSSNELSLLQRWANDVQDKQRGRAAYLQEIDRAKRELKSAKTELEEYDAELFDFISRGPYQPTLFDQPAEPVGVAEFGPAASTDESTPSDDATLPLPVEEQADIAVKLSTPVAELDLPRGVINALLEAGLSTVGEVGDWTKSGKELTDIKGIGQSKAEKILDACASVWQ